MNNDMQRRGICPICFKDHALKGQRMVDHGYTIPQDWHQRNGSCYGYHASHFGTPEGREETVKHIAMIVRHVEEKRLQLRLLGKVTKLSVKKTFAKDSEMIEVSVGDHLFHRELDSRRWALERSIKNATDAIAELTKRVDEWVEAPPMLVKREKTGPLMHMHRDNVQSFSLCTPRLRRTSRGYAYMISTKDKSKVTCPKCAQLIQTMESKQ